MTSKLLGLKESVKLNNLGFHPVDVESRRDPQLKVFEN